jgi:hypothetical protein
VDVVLILDFSYLVEEIFKASGQKASLLILLRHLNCVYHHCRIIIVTILKWGSLDCVCFASPCLTVGKDWAIVTLETLIDHRLSNNFENFFLRHIFTAHVVKSEALFLTSFFVWKVDLLVVLDVSNASSLGQIMRHVRNVWIGLIHNHGLLVQMCYR